MLMCTSAAILAGNPEQQQLPQGCLFFHIDHFAKYEGSVQLYTSQLQGGRCEAPTQTFLEVWNQTWENRIQNQSGRKDA